MSVTEATITYVPPGYAPYGDSSGRNVGGFNRESQDQRLVVFAKPSTPPEAPLLVFLAEHIPNPTLMGTELQAGEAIQVVAAGKMVYHDGLWAAKPDGEFAVHGIHIGWDRNYAHSLTLYGAERAVAVRASRSVSKDELISVALSVVWQ